MKTWKQILYAINRCHARIPVFTLVLMLGCCYAVYGQGTVEVSGKVTDAKDSIPLAGVSVSELGTGNGTTTDANGSYHLRAQARSTIVFSFLGYEKKEFSVRSGTLDVKLSAAKSALDEVVVVGYGTQKAKDVTGSVGTVNMQTLKNQPIIGANEALAGQIAGVQVNATNGIPGGGPQVQIRGVGAIGADNNPLYVVDGFPLPSGGSGSSQIENPLNNIPPSDIASISVLKDASATAIYGSRGANGVVIITTKQGVSGKLRLNVDLYNGWQQIPDNIKPKMMNATQFAEFQKDIIEDNNATNGTNTPIPEIYQNPSAQGKGTDWYEAMTRVAPMRSANISLSGGSDNFTAYMSAGYLSQDGVVRGTDYHKVSFRVNLNGQLNSKLKVGIFFAPTYSFGNNGITGGHDRNDPFGGWEVANPIPKIYNPDGSFNPMIGTEGTWNQPNPVMVLEQIVNKHTITEIISSAFVSYDILPSLTFKSTFNVDLNIEDQNAFVPSTIGSTNNPPPHIPSGYYGQSKFLNWANENSLTYNHTFRGGHTITLLGLFSEQEQKNNSGAFNGSQYPDDAIQTLNAASLITGATYADSWALASYLGRVNYSYKDKYLVTANIRSDGSSRFGINKRWGTFPSFALGWDITNEPWMKASTSALSHLKLRASYGITGNDEIGNFTYLSQLGSSNYVLGNSLAAGRIVTSISNPNLAWEKTSEINLGLDLGFFQGRLSLTADVYQSRTESLLLNLDIPQSSGFSNTIENVGKVQNKGIELAVNSTNVSTKNFSWYTNVNFTINRNKTLALGPNETEIQSASSMEGHPTNVTRIGLPVGMLFGYKVLGLYQNADDVAKSAAFPGAIPGNMKVEDVNGDGQITPVTDFTIIGNPYPKFVYAITNSLNYKGFNLNVVLTGSYGADMLDASMASLHNIDGIFNVLADVTKRWRSQDQPGDGKHPTTAGPSLGRVMYRDVHSWNVFKASYLWAKNISLSYTLPQDLTGTHFSNVQIYGSVQNAFILTSYPGNPAATNYTGDSGFGSALSPGIDYTNYPTPRVFVIGVRFNY